MANRDKFSDTGIFSGGSIATSAVADMAAFPQKVEPVFASYASHEVATGRGVGAKGQAAEEASVDCHSAESPLTARERQSWRRSHHEFAPRLLQN